MTRHVRAWFGTPFGRTVALLATIRVSIPLLVLAASGHDLRVFPRYDYVPLNGDAQGFYSAMRAVIAAAPHVHPVMMVVEAVALAASGVALRKTWRVRGRRWVGLLAVAAAVSAGASMVVSAIGPTGGAAVIGWSIVLAVPLAPFRVLGLGPDADATFVVGFALSLVCVALTTVATALLALRLTGRRSVAVSAAALWSLWPLLAAPLAGRSAWENSQWNVDVGLHLYTEPISTALVACAFVLVAKCAVGPTSATVAGILLGYASVVKLSNGLLAVTVVVVLGAWGARQAAAHVAAGAVAWLPLVVAYWPKGYVGMFGGQIAAEDDPFDIRYVGRGWGESLIFTPRLLAVLVPLIVLGLFRAPPRARWLLGSAIATTAAFYSFYEPLAAHPRFLYVVFPTAFVCIALGLETIADRMRALLGKRGVGAASGS